MNTVLDRRAFLKGLFGFAAIVAVAPALLAGTAEAALQKAAATATVDVGTGTVYISGGAHVMPGDRLCITYSSIDKAKGIYEVKAVDIQGTGEVTLAIVHENREIQLDRNEVDDFLNGEINNRAWMTPTTATATRQTRRDRRHPPVGRSRGGYTWPNRRQRGFR